MMSAETVRNMSRQAARRSQREGVVPLLVEEKHLEADVILRRHLKSVPFIGNRVPRGWRLLNASVLLGSEDKCVPIWPDEKRRRHYMQVDSSGFGAPDEYAFTAEQFYAAVRKIGPLRGYAIVEQGQFQVVVGVFEPIEGA